MRGRDGTGAVTGWGGPWILHGFEAFAVIFITFAWLKHKAALTRLAVDVADSPISLWLITAHLCSFAIFGLATYILYGGGSSGIWVAVWLAAGVSAIAFAGLGFIKAVFWLRLARDTGFLWIWAGAATILVCSAGGTIHFLWPLATSTTFQLSHWLLLPFIPQLLVDPANLLIGTHRFLVKVSPECSGLEGVGLILAFNLFWLVLFRRECRFPHALILLPVGAAMVFVLNAARIAALVLIGNAGAEQIAMHGFHSQAGWIVFNLIALGFCLAAREVPWLRAAQPCEAPVESFQNPTTRWVLPLVAILAAGLISTALTGDFEWFYPLRFFAAAVTLAFLWRRYRDLDWRVGWLAPAVGALVFLVWVGFDRLNSAVPEAMPAALAAAPPLTRTLWLIFRVLAATVTVPVAEELAFRGFLYRRLLSPDFESVSFRRFSLRALLISSLIFGFLHSDHWLVGTAAGVLYTLVLCHRGSIADAVAAHATTNALLVCDVFARHHWPLAFRLVSGS